MAQHGLWKRIYKASEAQGAALALLLSLVAAAPLVLAPGIVYTRAGGDSPFMLQRVQQLSLALSDGVFPVRWLPDANLGLGYPALNYYAALPYYLAAMLHLSGLGVIAAIQVTQALGFCLGGVAAYGLARALKLERPSALVASALFTMAPFHLVNVYVRGDSLSEFWAMGLVALCLLAVVRVADKPGPGRVAFLAAVYAALVLAHNITALLASPVLGLALLAACWRSPQRWRALGAGAGALILGLALSAWFWYPALAERNLVQLGQQTTGYFDFRGHFRGLDLVQPHLWHDYAIAPDADPFRMGLVQACLLFAGLIAVAVRVAHRRASAIWWVLSACVVGVTLLITPASAWLWERLPLLQYAQFPWRLLGLQAVLAAPLAGVLAEAPGKTWQRWTLAGLLVALASLGGLAALKPDRAPLNEADVTSERLMLFEAFSGNVGGTVRAEYLPAGVVPRYYASPQLLQRDFAALPRALSGALVSADLIERGANRMVWQIATAEAEQLVFPTVWFPGWQAMVDGVARPLAPADGLGLLSLDLAAGSHRLELLFGRTPTRRVAEWVSAVGAVALLALGVWWAAGSRRRAWQLLGGLGAMAVLVGWAAWAPIAPRAPAPLAGPLVMDLASYPYLHHEPEGISLGAAVLTGYTYDSDALRPGGELAIDLTWQNPVPGQSLQVRLLPLTAHIVDQSVVWGEINAPIEATQQRLTLPLPADLPPGVYVPRLGIKQDGKSLPIATVRGAPLSRASLAPVWVQPATIVPSSAAALALYGQPHEPASLVLLDVTTIRTKSDEVEVRLLWRAERAPTRNYALSLRRVGMGGVELESLDLAPMLPDYPTGLWRAGETVTVRALVAHDQGAIQEGDLWRIVLYDRLTMAAIGSTDAPITLAD